MVVLVVKDANAAAAYPTGASLTALPEDVPQSPPIPLSRRKPNEPKPADAELPAVISQPAANAKVERVTVVSGNAADAAFPVVLVRSKSEKGPWWVQAEVIKSEADAFTGKAVFGNDKTPEGAEFELVVLLLKTHREAQQYVAGQTVKELPEGVQRSQSVSVHR